jgi:hypothetical protein
LRWGEPRFTGDVDVTLLCPFGSEDNVAQPLLTSGYAGRISDAREFARRSRVLLLHAPNGVPIDIALAALPFEERMMNARPSSTSTRPTPSAPAPPRTSSS